MKNLKSLVAGICLLLTSCAKEPKTIYLNSLVLNLDDNIRTIACVSKKEGDEDIKKLLTQEYEEAWLYDGVCWHEIGFESSRLDYALEEDGESFAEVSLDYDYVWNFFSANDSLLWKHNHSYGNKKNQDIALKNWDSEKRKELLFTREIDLALPNDADIETLVSMQRDFSQEKKDGVFIGEVSSRYGVTSFYATEKGREYFYDKTEEEITNFAVERWNACINAESPESDNFLDWIKYYCDAMDNDYFECEFKPYTNLENEIISIKDFLENIK